MVKVIYIVVKLEMHIYVISSFAKQESPSDPEINEASGKKKKYSMAVAPSTIYHTDYGLNMVGNIWDNM